jgi:hypothetical protein
MGIMVYAEMVATTKIVDVVELWEQIVRFPRSGNVDCER